MRSMKVLLWSYGFCLGEGVGESEMIIGLCGVLGGVVSGEDGSWGMFTVVPQGS